MLIHLGWRRYPQLGGQQSVNLLEDFSCCPEVADIQHAGSDKHLVDLGALNLGQRFHIIWVVGAG